MLRMALPAEASLAAIRARSKLGMAIAAMIRMIATTISSSIRENPPLGAFTPDLAGLPLISICTVVFLAPDERAGGILSLPRKSLQTMRLGLGRLPRKTPKVRPQTKNGKYLARQRSQVEQKNEGSDG